MIESQGKIKNLKRLQQIPLFEGLRFDVTNDTCNTIQSPTDIDAFFEFQGKIAILTDYKLESKPLEVGQFKTFTHMIDAMQKGGYEGAYILVAEHNTSLDYPTYDSSICNVVKVYFNGEWITPPNPITVKEMYVRIFKRHNIALKPHESLDYLKIVRELFN
jgi:hypothetical protein